MKAMNSLLQARLCIDEQEMRRYRQSVVPASRDGHRYQSEVNRAYSVDVKTFFKGQIW